MQNETTAGYGFLRNAGKYFFSSVKTLKSIRSVSIMAMLVALGTVFSLFSIPVATLGASKVEVSFEFFPFALCGTLFGPVGAMVFGGVEDIVAALIKGDGFNLLYTFNSMLRGLLFGCVLYWPMYKSFVPSKKTNLVFSLRCVIAKILDGIIINILLNSYIASFYWGVPFKAAAATRIVSNSISLPIYLLIMIPALIFVLKNRKSLGVVE